MAFHVQVTEKQGYLHVRVTGDNTPETIRAYLGDVREICIQRKVPKVLIEEDLEGSSLPLADVFLIVSEASRNVWPDISAIAFVDRNPAHDFSAMRFAETVALNRGVNIRVFPEADKAEAWLAKV